MRVEGLELRERRGRKRERRVRVGGNAGAIIRAVRPSREVSGRRRRATHLHQPAKKKARRGGALGKRSEGRGGAEARED